MWVVGKFNVRSTSSERLSIHHCYHYHPFILTIDPLDSAGLFVHNTPGGIKHKKPIQQLRNKDSIMQLIAILNESSGGEENNLVVVPENGLVGGWQDFEDISDSDSDSNEEQYIVPPIILDTALSLVSNFIPFHFAVKVHSYQVWLLHGFPDSGHPHPLNFLKL